MMVDRNGRLPRSQLKARLQTYLPIRTHLAPKVTTYLPCDLIPQSQVACPKQWTLYDTDQPPHKATHTPNRPPTLTPTPQKTHHHHHRNDPTPATYPEDSKHTASAHEQLSPALTATNTKSTTNTRSMPTNTAPCATPPRTQCNPP
jgi:hypothetical protein